MQLGTRSVTSFTSAGLFFLFMLFRDGGHSRELCPEPGLGAGRILPGGGRVFLAAGAALLWLVVFLAPLAVLAAGISRYSSRLASDSAYDRLGFYVEVAGFVVLWLVGMFVRLVFDMAQVQAVVEDQRGMTRVLGAALCRTWRNLGTLFWMYFRASLVGWAGTVVVVFCWVELVPAERTVVSFILGQLVAWLWIATRLWQRASEVIWYQRQRPAALVPVTTESAEAVLEEGLEAVSKYNPAQSPAP